MTTEEIKSIKSMREVAAIYGISTNRKGFANCPFHNEKTASMKIYNDSFHCFGCGASGDIFTFVMKIEDCDFKTAFKILGGEYEHSEDAQRKIEIAMQARKERLQRERELKEEIQTSIALIDKYREMIANNEPFSDEWCEGQNKLVYQLYAHDCLAERKDEWIKQQT